MGFLEVELMDPHVGSVLDAFDDGLGLVEGADVLLERSGFVSVSVSVVVLVLVLGLGFRFWVWVGVGGRCGCPARAGARRRSRARAARDPSWAAP